MTIGQKQSIHLIYVNVSNALIYAEDLCIDDTLSKIAKDSVRTIRDRLKWIKQSIEIKTDRELLQSIDTLRYDEILRVVSMIPCSMQDDLEKVIIEYVNSRMEEIINKSK
jgi:hypothetical protein